MIDVTTSPSRVGVLDGTAAFRNAAPLGSRPVRLRPQRSVGHAGVVSGLSVVVAQVPSAVEAQIVVGLLQANDVAAVASSDDAGGQEPQLQLTQGVRVLVAPEDEALARQLIAEAGSDNV